MVDILVQLVEREESGKVTAEQSKAVEKIVMNPEHPLRQQLENAYQLWVVRQKKLERVWVSVLRLIEPG